MGVKDWKRLALKTDNGRKLWRRPGPKLGCRAKEREIFNDHFAFE
jgi:hypothetical protein